MRKTREILRLRWSERLSRRATATSVGCSPGTVHSCELRATEAGLAWPLPEDLNDAALEAKLYPAPSKRPGRRPPDFAEMYRQLKKRGVTLELLWHEYRITDPDGYQYSQFCNLYRQWRRDVDVVMRQTHRAGEKLLVDYAGMTMPIVDPKTGEISDAQIFVAALGASQYIYAEAQPSAQLRYWLEGHVHTFEDIGGVPAVIVPDNLKVGVKSPCYYEPDINPGYKDLADHFGALIIPARIRKPKDKAKVENAVLLVERWVLAPLRNQTFFSVDDLNEAMRLQLDALNTRRLSKLDTTRKALLNEVDRPALKPLPTKSFAPSQWKIAATVNIDYHVEIERHYYSVPYQLVGKKVDARMTDTVVEVLYNNHRVASHMRSYRQGAATTEEMHRPKAHQRHRWPPSRMIRWGEATGPNTAELIRKILEKHRHPEQGYRSCLGVIRLAKRYGAERLENACARATAVGGYSYRSVASILKTGLDQTPLNTQDQNSLDFVHHNIRGGDYYN